MTSKFETFKPMTLVFNHIPKTAGTSLRVILNKVYKTENVFFIKSKNISASYSEFENKSKTERDRFKVICGHGADLFSKLIDNPFYITVLREPVSLFVSQYNYLKNSPNSTFLNEVRNLETIEKYLEYAVEKGQDNLLTRYLSGSMGWLIQTDISISNMENEGENLLSKARQALSEYDAVLNLKDFDRGVFAISQQLGWKRIPFYRPQNQTKTDRKNKHLTSEFEIRLKHSLRFDIDLYQSFLDSKLDIAEKVNPKQLSYKQFKVRQNILNSVSRTLRNQSQLL